MQFAGVDWSITSPAVTIIRNDSSIATVHAISPFDAEVTLSNKNVIIHLHQYPLYVTEQERFRYLVDMFSPLLQEPGTVVALENYAFSRQPARMMQIAECTGLLKDRLQSFVTPTSTTVKKFATGNGRAEKVDMLEAFERETGTDLFWLFGFRRTKSIKQPLTDIADSYWLARFIQDKLTRNEKTC